MLAPPWTCSCSSVQRSCRQPPKWRRWRRHFESKDQTTPRARCHGQCVATASDSSTPPSWRVPASPALASLPLRPRRLSWVSTRARACRSRGLTFVGIYASFPAASPLHRPPTARVLEHMPTGARLFVAALLAVRGPPSLPPSLRISRNKPQL